MALSTHARHKVFERDKGICALCGCDCNFLKRMVWILRHRDASDAMWIIKEAWGLKRTFWGAWFVPSMWEADHIVPLSEGGTNDLSNYRTLCVGCHREQTRRLHKRLAARRRGLVPLF